MRGICRTMVFTTLAGAALLLPRVSHAQASDDDKKFLATAAQSDMNEIKLSELAEKKAVEPDVRAFAHTMVVQHTQIEDTMKPFVKDWGLTPPTGLDSDHQKIYDKLSKLSGKDFDKEYIAAMDKDHHKAEDLFKDEIKSTKDMKFQQAVMNGYGAVVAHTNMADSLKSAE
jgi:putative membrane protein